jgi:hypothetical protein
MNPIPKTTEADLIKIRTIKRKHVEQLIEPLSFHDNPLSWDGIEFLGYISSLNAILARVTANSHLRVIRADTYCYSVQNAEPDKNKKTQAYENARAFVTNLPQLLLD